MTKYAISFVSILLLCAAPFSAAAQSGNVRGSDLVPHVEVFFSPAQGTFIEGSTFQVSIFLNTKGRSVNAVELHIDFDQTKLSVVRPSSGTSVIGLWVEPPSYDNTRGTAKIVGTIPGGVTSDSALIATITFQAKASGEGSVSLSDTSQVLLNDGIGSVAQLDSNRGRYAVVPKPPAGATVFSETHPFQDHWYNNSNPIISWNQDQGVTAFSYVLDDKPTTVPDNVVTATDTIKAYENLPDGIWYFHIKALKHGVWGAPTTFLLRIDTTPPAEFAPNIDYLSASVIARFLVSFFTTDALSGIDHYEVGVIDQTAPTTESPVFVQTESPYQLPFTSTSRAQIIVRAFDRAGNIREERARAAAPFGPTAFITQNAVVILLTILCLIIVFFVAHYIFNHRVISRLEKGLTLLKEEEKKEKEMVSSNNTPPHSGNSV